MVSVFAFFVFVSSVLIHLITPLANIVIEFSKTTTGNVLFGIVFGVFVLCLTYITARNFSHWKAGKSFSAHQVGVWFLMSASLPFLIGFLTGKRMLFYTWGILCALIFVTFVQMMAEIEEKKHLSNAMKHVIEIIRDDVLYEIHVWKIDENRLSVTVRDGLSRVSDRLPKKSATYIYLEDKEEFVFCECGIMGFDDKELQKLEAFLVEHKEEIKNMRLC